MPNRHRHDESYDINRGIRQRTSDEGAMGRSPAAESAGSRPIADAGTLIGTGSSGDGAAVDGYGHLCSASLSGNCGGPPSVWRRFMVSGQDAQREPCRDLECAWLARLFYRTFWG